MGKRYIGQPFLIAKGIKIFVSYAHQRVTSAEEDFNNQMDRMTYLFCVYCAFSPATAVIAQWAQNDGHDDRDEDIHGLGNMKLLSPKPT